MKMNRGAIIRLMLVAWLKATLPNWANWLGER